MNKQGSILIEVVASIVILTLTTTFIIRASIQNADIIKERILLEEVNRDISNLIKEFKYNMTREEIDSMFINETIGFRYDGDFSKKLLDNDVKDLDSGTDIQVSKIGTNDIGLKLKIKANFKIEKREVSIENEFTKSWWMDEV